MTKINIFRLYSVLLGAIFLVFLVSCQEEVVVNPNEGYADDCVDNELLWDGTDDMDGDLDDGFFGDKALQGQICGLNIDTLPGNTIVLHYQGNNCHGTLYREGTITCQLVQGSSWDDAGSVMNCTYNDFYIRRISDNRYVTINGMKTIQNISGGRVSRIGEAGHPTTVVHNINASGMNVKFSNGSGAVWNVTKSREYTKHNGNIRVITFAGNSSNISESGQTKEGVNYYVMLDQPSVAREECGFKPSSGHKTIKYGEHTVVLTYGVDHKGFPDPIGCPGYFSITAHSGNHHTVTKVLAY